MKDKDDSLFKKSFKVTLGIVVALLAGLFILVLIVAVIAGMSSRQTTYNPVYIPTSTPIPLLTESDLALIALTSTSFNKNGNYDWLTEKTIYNPTITGTVTNKTTKSLREIVVKLKLYKNGNGNCSETPDDVQYITIVGNETLNSGDSHAYTASVPTSLDMSGTVNYCTEVYQARGY